MEKTINTINRMRKYLLDKGYQKATVEGYILNAKDFIKWLKLEQIKLGNLGYAEALKWVGVKQGQGLNARTINRKILSINHLYGSQNLKSPMQELRLRGVRHEVKREEIVYEDLLNLYSVYQVGGLVGKRNKVMLGVLIYQGVKRSELEKLKESDVDMERGLIRVPETGSTNSRILFLQANQILDLNKYLYHVRPELNTENSEALFISQGNGKKLANALGFLMRRIRKEYDIKLTATGIRQCVISKWLEEKNLREVQYMAGHRNVSSTFKYGSRSLKELSEEIERVHPLSG